SRTSSTCPTTSALSITTRRPPSSTLFPYTTLFRSASLMDVSVTEVISACMSLGIMVTMNQRLEADTIQLVADDFGYDVKFTNARSEEHTSELQSRENLVCRLLLEKKKKRRTHESID